MNDVSEFKRLQFWHTFKAIAVACVIAALAGSWVQGRIDHGVSGLRGQINNLARSACIANSQSRIHIISQYNDAIHSLIEQNQAALRINTKRGDTARVAVNAALISRLKGDLVAVQTPDCNKPVLR